MYSEWLQCISELLLESIGPQVNSGKAHFFAGEETHTFSDSQYFLPFKSEGRIPAEPTVIEIGKFFILSNPKENWHQSKCLCGEGARTNGGKGENGGYTETNQTEYP